MSFTNVSTSRAESSWTRSIFAVNSSSSVKIISIATWAYSRLSAVSSLTLRREAFASVLTRAKDWTEQDHCATKVTKSTPYSQVTLTTYDRSAEGASVELYGITGEGHEWPSTPVVDHVAPRSTIERPERERPDVVVL